MGKPSSSVVPASQGPQTFPSSSAASTTKSQDGSPPYASNVLLFFESVGISDPNVDNYSSKDFYSDLLCDHLKTDTVQRGHVTCFATVKPAVANYFGGLHGGVVAAIAERVAIATVRTVVGVEKDIFLGELGISYLSAAPKNAELIVDGSIVRSGRNVSVVEVEFKLRETGKLVYTCRATFYNSPIAKL
ncbi:acyl-coenzyme A thioesterase 13 [Herrania umbratica]|uniref:Acyl-coenzyme A thioesterase 13 n=1 Tax=Herrania umbratica TaxID=108875 RepID=A0A6J1A1M0_9ROSI|nr:acyl-coenzyme A thioesterase 13 [Herrania umbratica]